MSENRDWRKKQRALMNALREVGLHGETLRLVTPAEDVVDVVTVAGAGGAAAAEHVVVVEDLRDVVGDRALIVEDVEEECLVPVTLVGAHDVRLRLDAVSPASWRRRTRWPLARPTVVDGRHVTSAGAVQALCRITGLASGLWQIEVDSAQAPAPGNRLEFQSSPTGHAVTTFDVVEARGPRVLAARRPQVRAAAADSVMPHCALRLEFDVPELPRRLCVTTERFTVHGFVALAEGSIVDLPLVVGARLADGGLVVELTVVDVEAGRLEGRVATCDRVAWYNHVSRTALGFDTRLRPTDARPITRLMLESRNYTDRALQSRVRLGDEIARSYELDCALPSTRFRWLQRHSDGSLVGHLMGIQVSPRVWSAIDNVGSQSHAGRWNAGVVARWIRAFGELLEGLPGSPLIQWSFSVAAGVWTRFHEGLRGQRDLVYCENRFTNIVLGNLADDGASEAGIEVAPLTLDAMFAELVGAGVDASVGALLDSVCRGCEPGSWFAVSFEREYLRAHRRFYYQLSDERGARYVLTFANHPAWTSLNQGHNFHYLVPLGEMPAPTPSLLQVVREVVHRAGCAPFRVMYLGASEIGVPWIDLLLTPAAMPAAAAAAEAF